MSTETVSFDKSSKTTDANSSGSDLKVEIRTSSSGSGQVITDRWDGPTYPGHGNVYEEQNDVRAFPPFTKVGHQMAKWEFRNDVRVIS